MNAWITWLIGKMTGHTHTGSDGSSQITGSAVGTWAGTGDIADVTLTEAAGTGTAIPRGDHVHQLGSAVYSASATAATATNTAGVATTVSRGDHGHGVTWAGTGDIADVAATEGAGAGTAVPRGDHVHAIPSGLITNDMVNATAGIVATKLAAVPEVFVYKGTAQSINDSTYTALAFDGTEYYDTDTMYTAGTSTTRITCKTAGKYLVWASTHWDSSALGIRMLTLWLNGAQLPTADQQVPATGGYSRITVASPVTLAVNDYVEAYVYQTKGSAENCNAREFGAIRMSA